jgi:hypothetical protein
MGTPTVKELGLTRKEIHEARLIRDAEADPGTIRAPEALGTSWVV